jgi:ssDNA-binding Zn-finger/Zn-ribbon topoisomerase 1
LMDTPELADVPCPECRRTPVEVLKKLRSGRRFLCCPHCRAIWAVNRSASPTDPAPWVVAFGPSSMRRRS